MLIDDQPHRLELYQVWSSQDLQIPLRHQPVIRDKRCWRHLQDVPCPDVSRKKISMIIGTNVPDAFVPLEVRRGGPHDPIAIRSCLGFSLLSRVGDEPKQQHYDVHHIHITTDDLTLNEQVEAFWNVESLGTQDHHYSPMSVEDKRAMKIIDRTIMRENGHYQMGLLWKDSEPRLPFDRSMAEIRLCQLKRRLERDLVLKQKYTSVIDDYVAKGYDRKLTRKEAEEKSSKMWYLPHNPVLNPNKPGKVHVVFDAAAKCGGTSLNDKLLQGPDLINNLAGVLIRFRQEKVALIADVQAMFHQVRVTPDDCDALRFLWWSGDMERPPEDHQMLVHIFGATSSPLLLKQSLKTDCRTQPGEVRRGSSRNRVPQFLCG